MRRERERYAYGGYKYAPESYNFTLNGKVLNIPEDLKQTLRYKAACGLRDEVITELKRFVRKSRRMPNVEFITYGFFGKGEKNYYFTRDLLAKPNDFAGRICAYKNAKAGLQNAIDFLQVGYSCTTGEVSPFGSRVKSEEVYVTKLDLARPVIIKFVAPAIF